MKIPVLLAILVTAFVTDLAYRPWFDRGLATVDVPLLVVLFLAQLDRRPRLYLLVTLIAGLRALFGLEQFLLAGLPLALGVECQLLLRNVIHLRDPFRRIPALAFTLGGVIAFRAFLHSHLGASAIAWISLEGLILGTLVGALLFPILDEVTPLLKTHRYPL